jgi:hypothetical protein
MVKKVTRPPLTSRPTVEPRSEIKKYRSSADLGVTVADDVFAMDKILPEMPLTG